MKNPIFSIIMCTKNSASTLNIAIETVIKQTIPDWELLILDNGSNDECWSIIQNCMACDERIKGCCVEENIGWAKGASICLKEARGQYMIFLAADDFFLTTDCLELVNKQITQERPDIIWIGHKVVQRNKERQYTQLSENKPKYQVYTEENIDKITEIYEIMNHVYYNSFFHFENIEFLRKVGIDFYDPYYGDCEGMTQAMCSCRKSVVLDQCLYALTMNTSQTRNTAGWRTNVKQWQSITNAIIEQGFYEKKKVGYIAGRILNNNICSMELICSGGRVRNQHMNEIKKSSLERFQYLERVLESVEWSMMLYFSQIYDYDFTHKLLLCAKNIYECCIQDGVAQAQVHRQLHWLPYYVEALYEWDGQHFTERAIYPLLSFQNFLEAISVQENQFGFGFELIDTMIGQVEANATVLCQNIIQKYAVSQCRIIEQLLQMGEKIQKNRQTEELIMLQQECQGIYRSIQNCLSEERLKQISNRIEKLIPIGH